jgi:hypothetical protein
VLVVSNAPTRHARSHTHSLSPRALVRQRLALLFDLASLACYAPPIFFSSYFFYLAWCIQLAVHKQVQPKGRLNSAPTAPY